jgi:hypothetical protein
LGEDGYHEIEGQHPSDIDQELTVKGEIETEYSLKRSLPSGRIGATFVDTAFAG